MAAMYVLDFLAGRLQSPHENEWQVTEFRLLCSGALYNGKVMTTDWTKSDVVRRILSKPFSLLACSRPIDAYPQELALHISVPRLTETRGQFSTSFYPDEIIAQDLAVILCVYLRRLVSVAVKASVSVPDHPAARNGILPLAIIDTGSRVAWPHHPIGVATRGSQGEIKLHDYNPPPRPVDDQHLASTLARLPELPYATEFISSARLYAQALPLLGDAPDIAYQLLISAVETMASAVLKGYTPPRGDMLNTTEARAVIALAQKLNIPEDQAEELALAACAGERWISRKFRIFLMERIDDSLWQPDNLFKLPVEFTPPKDDLEKVLKIVYATRSTALHEGQSWQDTIRLGWGPTMPFSAVPLLFEKGLKVPPVVWFERLVNMALNQCLASSPA